jgi:hypothetical protein
MRSQEDGNDIELGGRQCPTVDSPFCQAIASMVEFWKRGSLLSASFQLRANDVAGFAGFGAGSQHCPAVTLQTLNHYPGRLPAVIRRRAYSKKVQPGLEVQWQGAFPDFVLSMDLLFSSMLLLQQLPPCSKPTSTRIE